MIPVTSAPEAVVEDVRLAMLVDAGALLIIVSIGISLWWARRVPADAQVPTHWGLNGADQFIEASWAVYFWPVAVLGAFVVAAVPEPLQRTMTVVGNAVIAEVIVVVCQVIAFATARRPR